MSTQPEQVLENNLVLQLQQLGYGFVTIRNEADLFTNLKTQLEALNNIQLSDNEFKQVLNSLEKGTVFEKAKTLRDRLEITTEDNDSRYIQLLNPDWEKNRFQVTQQVTIEGSYKNRYDVTILVNGLPLVQIELKRRGLELKEAFNQINRYQKHSYWASNALFQYVQIFVISNGVNTKYYANNRKQSFKQTFFWADISNERISKLENFTEAFLNREHLTEMVSQFLVLNQTDKVLMVMRPYQVYATKAIVQRVKRSEENGYIWHTTGSGKTLTSFKTAQILTALADVHKVVFVVDRKDLDYQTSKEFNSFAKGCVDSTSKTNMLVQQFTDTVPMEKGKDHSKRNTKLIVTTLQKLNRAISHKKYLGRMETLKDKRIVFIFDECHRSQFGDTHKRITSFFTHHQLFGFTGTPILVKNATTKASVRRTTKDLFDKCLHQYTIVDAIRDENVLKFNVEYVGRYKKKDSANEVDIDVEDIDRQELMDSPQRLGKIVDYILQHHKHKTRNGTFTGMFCVSSVPALIKYYELFKQKKVEGQHSLKIATIFSYTANEDDQDANGFLDESEDDIPKVREAASAYDVQAVYGSHTRDKLEAFIGDYNEMFSTKYTTKDQQSFYNYYNDISKRVRDRQVDILLVVNMFLTGFDSKPLNTLYVDKSLKHHGLIQAFSRTNRILNEQKPQGNIVCFRNLKKATDDALRLFSDKDAQETVLLPPYEEFVKQFAQAYGKLLALTPTIDSVDDLKDEEQELEFIKQFRELMRLRNILQNFGEYKPEDLAMPEQMFEDFKSKYLDLYEKAKSDQQTERTSILEDVDFELELIHRDEVNVAYILRLLAELKDSDIKEFELRKQTISDLLKNDPQLRSKKDLIEEFIDENLRKVPDSGEVEEAFESFWDEKKTEAIEEICIAEKLDKEKFIGLVDNFMFTQKEPLREDVFAVMQEKPKIRERKPAFMRITEQVKGYVETFFAGM
ncbi:type I restriction endonuclease subunit R [Endozoicomonas atrinae]|uniref:type I restriction endonuclease subunit R n=1 Tax=Endozoicomonas atrinae TaxID=1333660 RepID=UPI000823FC93|nr:type I restriction endonuclease subunit R [Endozoicomonas atrinae]